MREIVTTVTQRNQVTIPAEVRRRLGIKPRDKVAFTIDEDGVRLVPVRQSPESVFGSVEPIHRPEDVKDISRLAKQAHTRGVVRDLTGP